MVKYITVRQDKQQLVNICVYLCISITQTIALGLQQA